MEITADLDTYESKLNALQETLDEVIRKLGEIDETALRIRENASVAPAPVQGTASGTVLTPGINTGVNSNTLGIG
jgi:predicted metalloenzyme YecM